MSPLAATVLIPMVRALSTKKPQFLKPWFCSTSPLLYFIKSLSKCPSWRGPGVNASSLMCPRDIPSSCRQAYCIGRLWQSDMYRIFSKRVVPCRCLWRCHFALIRTLRSSYMAVMNRIPTVGPGLLQFELAYLCAVIIYDWNITWSIVDVKQVEGVHSTQIKF